MKDVLNFIGAGCFAGVSRFNLGSLDMFSAGEKFFIYMFILLCGIVGALIMSFAAEYFEYKILNRRHKKWIGKRKVLKPYS